MRRGRYDAPLVRCAECWGSFRGHAIKSGEVRPLAHDAWNGRYPELGAQRCPGSRRAAAEVLVARTVR